MSNDYEYREDRGMSRRSREWTEELAGWCIAIFIATLIVVSGKAYIDQQLANSEVDRMQWAQCKADGGAWIAVNESKSCYKLESIPLK